MTPLRDRLLDLIPDTPVWVEARGALLAGGDVFGEPGAAVIRTPCKTVVCLAGRPTSATLDEALEDAAETVEVIGQVEDADHAELLIGMPGGWARIYAAGPGGPRPSPMPPDCRLEELTEADRARLRHLPDELRAEIEDELSETRIVAAVADGLPVSFCYPGSVTERWWDVAIDTVEPYRRRGLAAAAFCGLYERMSLQGKRAVWGAMEWNEASWRLAEKLGLEPAGGVLVWTANTFS